MSTPAPVAISACGPRTSRPLKAGSRGLVKALLRPIGALAVIAAIWSFEVGLSAVLLHRLTL